MQIDTELDRLYQVLPDAFVAERNALAKALRRDGDKANADAVARLARPTPVAWTVNQLHFKAPRELEALRRAGLSLRRAQEETFEAEAFATHRSAHQEALKVATERGMALALEGGLKPNAAFQRRLESMLGLIATAGEGEQVSPPPGRMSLELDTVGFDAFDVVAAPPPRSRRGPASQDTVRAQRIAAVKDGLDGVTREVRRLEARAGATADQYARAARDAEEAEARARRAVEARDEALRAAESARKRLETARVELQEARRVYDELIRSSSDRKPAH